VWAGAALTKPGRTRTARWSRPGERDGKEHERNPRYCVSQVSTGLNLADQGWERCTTHRAAIWPVGNNSWAGYGRARREAMVNVHGVTMARPQGQSGLLTRRANSSERGNVSVLTRHPGHQHGSWAGSTVDRSGRDGAEPP
jgi:hypothetical protein